MSRMLFTCFRGTDDPVQATFPFEFAVASKLRGHDVSIALLGEATVLMKPEVSANLHALGCPPFQEVLDKVIEHQIPIYV